MATDTSTLNDLIDILDDGRNFYTDAAAKAERPEHRQLFERMVSTKTAIVTDLKSTVAASGEKPHEGGSTAGGLRQAWGELRAKLSSDTDAQYIAQLEEFEDRILHSFEGAVQDSDDAAVRGLAQKYMPEVRRDHDRMRALKQQAQRAT